MFIIYTMFPLIPDTQGFDDKSVQTIQYLYMNYKFGLHLCGGIMVPKQFLFHVQSLYHACESSSPQCCHISEK